MRRSLRNRAAVLASASLAAFAFSVPFAIGSFQSSADAGSASFATATLAAPGGPSIGWGTCVRNTSFQMNLGWNAVANATSYQVFRGTAAGGPYTQIGTAGGTSYTDAGPQVGPPALTWNTTYYYVVRAVRWNWTSGSSGEVSLRSPKAANCN